MYEFILLKNTHFLSSNWDDKYDRIYIDMRHREFLSKDCILPKVSPDRLIEREGTPEPASTARQVHLFNDKICFSFDCKIKVTLFAYFIGNAETGQSL